MRLHDRVHGSVQATEPLLVQLVESPALQRLKGVDVAGYFEPWRPGSARNRFEHSVGVMWTLRTHGASVEEQAAGLIHDVSHGAFSHCLDYVLAEGGMPDWNQSDALMERFLEERTDIPAIVARHGLTVAALLDDARHPLKEQPLPDLCADRIDYSLRDAVALGLITAETARRWFAGLRVVEGKWAFADVETARAFSEQFRQTNNEWYAGFPSAAVFRSVCDWLRHALQRGYLAEADLYGTDADVIARVNAYLAEDAALARFWRAMSDPAGWKNDPSRSEARTPCKMRLVDPLVSQGAALTRLSALQPDWGAIVQAESVPRDWYPVYEG